MSELNPPPTNAPSADSTDLSNASPSAACLSPESSRRFDSVDWTEFDQGLASEIRSQCQELEALIAEKLNPGRPKNIALAKLDEMWFWIGRSVVDGPKASGDLVAQAKARHQAGAPDPSQQ